MIPDDPIISCIMRTGYAPWNQYEEEIPEEHDDYYRLTCMEPEEE